MMLHVQVALLAGCLYTAVGILRLGWITNFLSHSVICGFMTGASVIIALSQVRALASCPQFSDLLQLTRLVLGRAGHKLHSV